MPEDAHLRRRDGPGPRHPQGRDEDQAGHRRDAPELQRLRLADGLREHRLLRPDVHAPCRRGRADQDVRPGREAERAVQEPVRRAEAACRHRHCAGQRPGDRVPGRADDRPGPAGQTGRLGSDQSPEEPGQDCVPDDALHGRGLLPGGPDRCHPQGQDHSRRRPRRPDQPVRRRQHAGHPWLRQGCLRAAGRGDSRMRR